MAILKNMSIFSKISNYLKEVRIELKKVNMPTRQETIKYTLIVIGLSFVVAVFLGGFDFLFTWIVSSFLL
ncbi:MAG TPA: preprotein translocase subunit SecE [Candidatus Paceibacterota bacterium]|nr:preprotein translocase subunit SecE [Candidatus Paceibacterota bacterium]